jgi:hypothetical protein
VRFSYRSVRNVMDNARARFSGESAKMKYAWGAEDADYRSQNQEDENKTNKHQNAFDICNINNIAM